MTGAGLPSGSPDLSTNFKQPMIMETGEFHLEQGLCFKRMDDKGSVRIRRYKQPIPSDEKPEIEFEAIIDDSSWASTVASVSARDEDADTWEEALDYHNK